MTELQFLACIDMAIIYIAFVGWLASGAR